MNTLAAKTLHLIIKKQYFDDIINGSKVEEYRIVNQYYMNKLIDKEYSDIIFQNGYSKNSPKIHAKYNGYILKSIKHPFWGTNPVNVFALQFSNPVVILK